MRWYKDENIALHCKSLRQARPSLRYECQHPKSMSLVHEKGIL